MRDSPLPESLSTIHAVVLAHAKPACALAGPMTLAKRVCNCRSGLHFRRNQSPARTIRPPSPIQYPQKPSGAHSNPIGRSPRPSQTPATYFKRPYRALSILLKESLMICLGEATVKLPTSFTSIRAGPFSSVLIACVKGLPGAAPHSMLVWKLLRISGEECPTTSGSERSGRPGRLLSSRRLRTFSQWSSLYT